MNDEQSGQQFAPRQYGTAADAYDRGRPTYPREAAQWLVGGQAGTVLELGAGTGKLTEHLVALGHDVHACDPDAAMLEVLARRVPKARTTTAAAEEIPAEDRSVDVVVVAQAFHWFDHEVALPEIARVLKPGGALGLVWNQRDERIPWVRRLGRLLGDQDSRDDLAEPLASSGLFGFVDEKTLSHWQEVNRETIQDLALSRSNVLAMGEEQREAKRAEVLAFYEDFGRGMDGMQLPYRARCYRAVVTDRPRDEADPDTDDTPESRQPEPDEDSRFVSDGTDTDMLLIDFR